MSTYTHSESAQGEGHQMHLFDQLPCWTTQLVCEKRYPYPPRIQVCSPADVAAIMFEYYTGKDREEFAIVLLNTANIIIGFSVVSVGGLAASIVEPRQVFKVAILANAASIICAHNHPSGASEPSRQDIAITRQLVEAGKIIGIPIHDHLVLGLGQYTSLAERGLLGS